MSLILNAKKFDIPNLEVKSWLDGVPWIKEITDFNLRTLFVRLIIVHTHKGVKGKLLPGMGVGSGAASSLVRYQVNTERKVSWDYTIDSNGVVYCQNDPVKKYSWQAGSVNPLSFGIEIVQQENGDVYEGQIEKAVLLIDALTALLGIQRQICWDSTKNAPRANLCQRLVDGGSSVVGIAGHRNQSKDRGPGDPGDFIYLALQKAGYDCFDLNHGEDIDTWKGRQQALGMAASDCDGVAGPKTVEKLKAAGYPRGLWVSRPVDSLIATI